MLTILPERRSIMCAATALHMKNGPLTLTAKFSSQSSPVSVVNGADSLLPKWPALLTRMSTWPKASRACRTTSVQSSSLVTSPSTARPRRPACPAAAAVSCARATSRSDTTTSAPSRVRQAQMPRPMPPPPPVTMATLSCKRMPRCATQSPVLSRAAAVLRLWPVPRKSWPGWHGRKRVVAGSRAATRHIRTTRYSGPRRRMVCHVQVCAVRHRPRCGIGETADASAGAVRRPARHAAWRERLGADQQSDERCLQRGLSASLGLSAAALPPLAGRVRMTP